MIQKLIPLLLGLATLSVLGFAAVAGDHVNDKCPITEKAVDGSTTTDVDGSSVALCCVRCKNAFDKWDAAKKTSFVQAAAKAKPAKQAAQTAKAGAEAKGELASAPYLLNVCAVSGEELGSMGEPITKTVAGREVKFCCKGCVGKYEEKPERFAGRIDEAMAKQQRPYYALQTCVISGEPLGDEPAEVVVANQLVKACCKMCAGKVRKTPAEYVAQVQRANAAAQSKAYPLQDCAVSGEALGSMGDPIEKVVAGRLVKLCCKGCAKGLAKNPARVIAKIDAAWAPIHAKAKK